MTKNDKWIEDLRAKMKNHQETPPEGLWKDIEKALPAASDNGGKVVGFWRWSAAAAIAVAILGGGLLYWKGMQTPSEQLTMTPQVENPIVLPEKSRETSSDDKVSEVDDPVELTSSPRAEKSYIPIKKSTDISKEMLAFTDTAVKSEGKDIPESPSTTEIVNHSDEVGENTSNITSLPSAHDSGVISKDATISVAQKAEQELINNLEQNFSHSTNHKTLLTVGLYADNSMLNKVDRSDVANYYSMSNAFIGEFASASFDQGTRKMVLNDYYQKKHHHQPFSVGLTARVPLSQRWSVETGLVYTYLRSDFITHIGSADIEKQQTLHYVGIPANMLCQLLRWGRFRMYLSAGGQVDFNVSASMTTEGDRKKMGHDRAQFSATASVGAQYDITPAIGLYVEPGVRHYFNNGSDIENTFKEKETNFNLQLGLRFNIE